MSKQTDSKANADKTVRNIQRQTRRKFNAEEKIRIGLAGLRGNNDDDSISGGYHHDSLYGGDGNDGHFLFVHQNLRFRGEQHCICQCISDAQDFICGQIPPINKKVHERGRIARES